MNKKGLLHSLRHELVRTGYFLPSYSSVLVYFFLDMIKQSSIIFALSLIIILIVNFHSIFSLAAIYIAEDGKFPLLTKILPSEITTTIEQKKQYTKAREVFNSGNYIEAKTVIQNVLSNQKNNTFSGEITSNCKRLLGDIMYTIGSGETDTEKKIAAYRASLEAYTGSYQIEKNPDVEKNYRFVEEKLKELLKQPSPSESGSG